MIKFTYKNSRDEPRTLILEPWAEEYVVPTGSLLLVTIQPGEPGLFAANIIETEDTPEYFVMWLWSGCQAEVQVDGKIVSGSTDIRTP